MRACESLIIIFFFRGIYSQKLFIALNGIFGVLFVTLFVPCSRQAFDLILNERNCSDVGSEGVFQSSVTPCGTLNEGVRSLVDAATCVFLLFGAPYMVFSWERQVSEVFCLVHCVL